MSDHLDILANDALKSIKDKYYDYEAPAKVAASPKSLKDAILGCKRVPIISEIKFASPSRGIMRENYFEVEKIAKDMEKGGAVGISILTEPKHFNGHVKFIAQARNQVNVPILMKDIILSPVQIDAAYRNGANAILLIQTLFERDYCEKDIQSMIEYSHSRNLEVLLEVHTEEEFLKANETNADMIGINNRDLKTLKVNLEVTKCILNKYSTDGNVIVSESGINNPEDIRLLRKYGAQAFLVGTTIMEANNIQEKVKQLVESQ